MTEEEKKKIIRLEQIGEFKTKIESEISGKVDKITGKGLSTNDYTNEEKQKVADALVPADIAGKANTSDVYTKEETYSKTEVNNLVSTPHQEYVSVSDYASLPATGSADTIYRVSNYDGTQVDATKYAEYAWDGTQYILLSVKSAVGEVFDVSEYNSGATYETLAAALAAVPASVQRGGMSIMFKQGTSQSSDNKYVQFRYMGTSTADADFTNTANWQGVDDEPTEGSENLVKSGGVYAEVEKKANIDGYYETMGVGTADNLTGQTERTNDAMYRKTGGSEEVASGTATISNIKGNTVAWNQRSTLQYSKYVGAVNNITISVDGTKCTVADTNYNGSGGDAVMIDVSILRAIIGNKYIVFFNSGIIQGDGLTNPQIEGVVVMTNAINIRENTWCVMFTCQYDENILRLKYKGNKVVGDSWYFDKPMLFDLTLIYGAGNEPTTSEQFEADYERWFGKPLTYEEYDAGSLRPVLMQSVKTTGFNQWDEEWEYAYYPNGVKIAHPQSIGGVNLIKVYSGKTYYFRGGLLFFIGYYNSDAQYIQNHPDYNDDGRVRLGTGGSLTIPSGVRFIRISGYNPSGQPYNHDICINISDPSKNGTYEPYEEKVQGFDVTAIKGKLNGAGNSVAIFPDGLKKAGNIQDEIFVEGGVVKAIKRVGSVDLGTLDFVYSDTRFSSTLNGVKSTTYSRVGNGVCAKYMYNNNPTNYDKAFFFNTDKVYIYDSAYTDAAAFKTAMNGVMLYYELATPLVYELDTSDFPIRYQVNNNGTEEQIQKNGVQGVAAILTCIYGVDAVKILDKLPQNYISEKSMDNFFAQLNTVTGGTWTKTWNDNTGEWDFSFTPNAQTNDTNIEETI